MQTPQQQVDLIYDILDEMLRAFDDLFALHSVAPYISLMRQWHDYITVIRSEELRTPDNPEIAFLRDKIQHNLSQIQKPSFTPPPHP
jgi:hypothetical protein